LFLNRACFRFTEGIILPDHSRVAIGAKSKILVGGVGGLPKLPKSAKFPPARCNFAPPCATIFDCRVQIPGIMGTNSYKNIADEVTNMNDTSEMNQRIIDNNMRIINAADYYYNGSPVPARCR
jgi:hypothetical protein